MASSFPSPKQSSNGFRLCLEPNPTKLDLRKFIKFCPVLDSKRMKLASFIVSKFYILEDFIKMLSIVGRDQNVSN